MTTTPYPDNGNTPAHITLQQLSARVAHALTGTAFAGVWVTAELSDVRISGAHCYMELVERDPYSAMPLARMRAIIWANNLGRIRARFVQATGQQLQTGLKLLLCGTVSYHASYGISLVVQDIDPSYTMGEAERHRREILDRLKHEGVAELNRQLPFPIPPLRIAVISAAGAAGYGDFCNQLYSDPSRLRFTTQLFPAVMQGASTPTSVISALDTIAQEAEKWDCVAIIRGGGSTTDLQSFDDYRLASNVAQFPLPIIIGIGHERDVTVLDYIAALRVKTPTAAAEWLIAQGHSAIEHLHSIGTEIHRTVTDRISGSQTQLAHYTATLAIAPISSAEGARNRLNRAAMQLESACSRRIQPQLSRLQMTQAQIPQILSTTITHAHQRLDSATRLVEALSPQATLERGYTLTIGPDGHALQSSDQITQGTSITTLLAKGKIISIVQ